MNSDSSRHQRMRTASRAVQLLCALIPYAAFLLEGTTSPDFIYSSFHF